MATMTGATYPISKPVGLCAATGKPIAVGDRFVAALVERPDSEELARLDFAQAAWDAGERPKPPLRLFGCWRTVMPPPDARKKAIALGDDELLDLFDQLASAEEPKRRAFRFLLGLLLVRKKLLKYEGQRPGLLIVRHKGDATQPVELADPGSASEALGAAIEQLGEIMDLGPVADPRGGST